jgi:hypothetical protein
MICFLSARKLGSIFVSSAEIVHTVAESVINFIACTVFEAHRTGRMEAYTYLKDFVLEKIEGPDGLIRCRSFRE